MAGIWKGFGPTFVGYSLQGMFKYGLYEVFKDLYMNMAGEEAAEKYKPAIWLLGSASAEVFADVALCPLEMTKVKIQTSPTGTFPIAFGAAIKEMRRTKVETRYPFGSLVPLWSRQVSTSPVINPSPSFNILLARSHIPWPSSSSSRRLCRSFTPTYSPSPSQPMAKAHSSVSHSHLVTSRVSSAPSSRTQLIRSSPFSEKLNTRVNQLVPSPAKLALGHWPQKASAPG